jgi:hypothetical protein
MSSKKKITAQAQPDGNGHQISYEAGDSRRVHHFPRPPRGNEPSPHAAGSYHDPEHHHDLIGRVEEYLREQA